MQNSMSDKNTRPKVWIEIHAEKDASSKKISENNNTEERKVSELCA